MLRWLPWTFFLRGAGYPSPWAVTHVFGTLKGIVGHLRQLSMPADITAVLVPVLPLYSPGCGLVKMIEAESWVLSNTVLILENARVW